MDAFIIMLRNVLVFLALAVPGYLLVKLRILKEEDTPPLSKVLVNVGLPFLIFSTTLKMDFSGDAPLTLGIVAVSSVALLLVTVLIANVVTVKIKDRKVRAAANYAMSFSNSGFLGIPLATAVFGTSPIVDYVVVCNVVCCIGLNTIGVYIFTGDKKQISLHKILLNPAFLAFIIGVVVNLLGVTKYVPEISLYATNLSGIVTPLSMMIVGVKFASIKPIEIFKSLNMYRVSFVKLIVQPVIIVTAMLIVNIFTAVESAIILGAFMAFSMPSPGTTTSFADMYDGDVDGAVKYTLGSTILSVITIPLLYSLITLIIF